MKSPPMKIVVVSFNPEGDGVTAMYVDGRRYTYGDYYHNKIDDWIKGFVGALEYLATQMTVEYDAIPGEKCKPILNGGEPPEKWPDRKYYKHRIQE